jgi:hypothetical protein
MLELAWQDCSSGTKFHVDALHAKSQNIVFTETKGYVPCGMAKMSQKRCSNLTTWKSPTEMKSVQLFETFDHI